MRSLIIGRFQPLHLGHVKMIEYAAAKSKFLTIGLGSCNLCDTYENPFTAEEREHMIKESVSIETPYEIKRIPDFGDPPRWAAWIADNINFDAVMTNSPCEKEIFTKAGKKVIDIPFFDRQQYSASEVRDRILADDNWVELLPAGTVKVMTHIDGKYRIASLTRRHKACK